MLSLLLNGFIIGWSVAWPPGPVNAEIIRRGLLPKQPNHGFWFTWKVGVGACAGDFIWALAVSAGAGALLNRPQVRNILGVTSLFLLAALAVLFVHGAWKTAREHQQLEGGLENPPGGRADRGCFLGLLFALSSPWNIGFWLAVVGSQQTFGAPRTVAHSILLAVAVVLGALAWTIVLVLAVRSGARIFAKPSWQVWTQIISALVMIYFAAKLAYQMFV